MVNETLTVSCGPLDANGRRKVTVQLGKLHYNDHGNPDQAFWRKKWRESIISRFSLAEDAHEFLETELQIAVERADDFGSHLWEAITTTLADVNASTPDYLWEGRVAFGMLHCVDGDGGVGKGLSLMDLAARGSRGDVMPPDNAPSGTNDPWSTLFITSEDSPEYVLRPRAEAAGADLSRIITMSSVQIPESDKRSVALLQDLPLIEQVIRDNNVKLLNIDPWSEFLDPQFNVNSDPDNRKVLGPLSELAQRTGVAAVLVRHLSKKEGSAAQYRGLGSTAPLNASRAAFIVAPDPEDPDLRVMACTKFNIGLKPSSLSFRIESAGLAARVVWEGETSLSANDLVSPPKQSKGGKLDRAKEIIEEILSSGPRGSSEVMGACEAEGISQRTYHTARKAMNVKSEKTDFRGQWLLTLPSTNGASF